MNLVDHFHDGSSWVHPELKGCRIRTWSYGCKSRARLKELWGRTNERGTRSKTTNTPIYLQGDFGIDRIQAKVEIVEIVSYILGYPNRFSGLNRGVCSD